MDDEPDDEPDDECPECDFRFQVIFCADAYTVAANKRGERIVKCCPRCGADLYDGDEIWD